jgi:CobQ/CobB/MinD/ParA nucleotide binding domain
VFVSCWALKGGVGTTVVTASLGLTLTHLGHEVLLVDLGGDLPAALGLSEPDGPGLTEWLAAGPDVPADGLGRLEVAAASGLAVLPRGHGPLGPTDRVEALVAALGRGRSVVADCGVLDGREPDRAVVAGRATHSLLVTRACYLALRRAADPPLRPSGVILVTEPGRALDRTDVEQVVGAPVRAEVAVDPAVARAVDAGLLANRLPRTLERSLRRAA